jgi:hypothetical protein
MAGLVLGMAGLALVTPRTAAQGGHGLEVKTMFRFNPSSPNKDECCGRTEQRQILSDEFRRCRAVPVVAKGRALSFSKECEACGRVLSVDPTTYAFFSAKRFLTRAISEQFPKTSRT